MITIGTAARRQVPGDPAQTRSRLETILAAQRRAFVADPPGYAERLEALRALEQALLARQTDLVNAVSQDFGGRAAEETLALEVVPLLNEIRHACRNLKRWMAPRRARVEWQCWPATARIVHNPLGVVGIVSPWNYPVYLSLTPLVGALAAGNHVLLRPSELAPATANVLHSLVSGVFRPDYVAVITGDDADTAAGFVRLPLDHLLFTGSSRVGRLVMRAQANTWCQSRSSWVARAP